MAQGSNFPLRKPPGFHYDFFLLGITTFIAGLIGVPAPNGMFPGLVQDSPLPFSSGLIPQAPIHTQSLVVLGRPKDDSEKFHQDDSATVTPSYTRPTSPQPPFNINPYAPPAIEEGYKPPPGEVPVAVVEQRVSNLAQGALCLVLLTGPFLRVLGHIPRGG